jgi:hypothetical protein
VTITTQITEDSYSKREKEKKRFGLIDSWVKNCQYMIQNNKEKTTAKLPEWKVLLSIYCHDN